MIKKLIPLLFVAFAIANCSNDDDRATNCDRFTIVDSVQFENAPKDQVTVNSVSINNDCLKINFSASGCNGDTWEIKLIDSNGISFSLPPQRDLRLSLKNDELCDAIITKELTFDIRDLQVEGNELLLNIENFADQIRYEY